jgi:phosphopantetheinyl transferase
MPLVYQQNINLHSRLGVWHIMEEERFFLNKVRLQNGISHPHKRLQHLAGRYLLTELYEDFPLELILIAETRKPFLDNEVYHFSISHCGRYAAAIVSRENRVGVDIEVPHGKIVNVRHKFLKDTETQLLQDLPMPTERSLTLAWSIKEALFKWYGAGKVDFRGHMHIQEIVCANDQYIARCLFTKETPLQLNVHALFFNDNCLAWVVS